MTTHFRVVDDAAAADVHALTQAAFAGYGNLDPPSGALRETVDDVAAELREVGGLVGVVEGVTVAALRFSSPSERAIWVRRVAVHPAHQGGGIGTALMEHALAEAARRGHSELHVGVRLALTANRRWYARLGYAELGHRRHEGTGAVNWAELVAFVPVISESPEAKDTRMFGERLAGALRAGDLVVLTGPLGAGKTVVAQGIGAGLGVTGAVVSPTFVIARVHRGGRLPMVHVDAYRLSSVAEVDDLDLDASLEESVTVVEWGLGKVEQLADSHLQVDVTRRDDDTRQIEVTPFGAAWLDRDVRAAVSP